jgi:regulator of sirC expression with transglutaminase-like and TPR domain
MEALIPYKSLISLLDDPDEEVYNNVFAKLCECGPVVIPQLENEWEHNVDELVQLRLETLIHTIQFDSLKNELKTWVLNHADDLQMGILIFNKYHYPEANDKLIVEKIETLKKQIWIELNYQLTPIEQIRVFNLIFFKHHHFHSNFEHPTDPKNNFITYTIETKKGNQIGLGLIYLLVAQQLRMPVYGVCLKNYFVICYVDTDIFQSDINYINQQDILFYINPYNLGAIFNRPQILDYLQKIKSEVKDKYFYPATNIEIMKELISQTAHDYQLLQENDKVNEMRQLLQLLKK